MLYLEGVTDPQPFFAALGLPVPRSGRHQDVQVVGLSGSSGGAQVAARVRLAKANGLERVLGVVDGDGLELGALADQFDPPCEGPLFKWKAYCIENLLAQGPWPVDWGPEPHWPEVFKTYGAYVAVNRLHLSLRDALGVLGLSRFRRPALSLALLSPEQVQASLAQNKLLLMERDVSAEFERELQHFNATVDQSMERAHALLNGKWLVEHYAVMRTNLDAQTCRDRWCEALRAQGGLPEVRAWWTRVTGRAP